MVRSPATDKPARILATQPVPAPIPDQLWLLRDKRTGQWVMSHQESIIVHRKIILSLASPEAVTDAVAFLARFCLIDAEPVQIR